MSVHASVHMSAYESEYYVVHAVSARMSVSICSYAHVCMHVCGVSMRTFMCVHTSIHVPIQASLLQDIHMSIEWSTHTAIRMPMDRNLIVLPLVCLRALL